MAFVQKLNEDFYTFTGVYTAIYMGSRCRSYILHVQKCQTSEMLDEWSPTSKLSDIKLSHIPDGWNIYLLHENLPVCHTCFWYLQIFPRVFPWLNFEYWITCHLCWFRCKLATFYVLLHFSNVFADWYFCWLYLSFHWLSFCEFFSGVFFSWA